MRKLKNNEGVYDEWGNVHNETHGDTLLTEALDLLFFLFWCFSCLYPCIKFFAFCLRLATEKPNQTFSYPSLPLGISRRPIHFLLLLGLRPSV